MISSIITAALLSLQLPFWETDIGYLPFSSPLLASNGNGSMDIFVAMGDHGLGGWSGSGQPLPGFPISLDRGVSRRPAALFSNSTGPVIVYTDNIGNIHMVDHNGVEKPGWPVFKDSRVVTGISVVDLDYDGEPEIAFGTADGKVHLLTPSGRPVQGWPHTLPARLQWQPTQLSLGGNEGFGLVCALVTNEIYILSPDGEVLPGWPLNIGYTSSTIPVTADIDADGLGDVIFATINDRIYAVNYSGGGVEGWPFFLDDRASNGSIAIGHLDPDIRGLQIVVSSLDGDVTLINGSGRIAGTWRWPNTTAGKPTSPIIARTGSGLGVIVGSDSGYVYGWNADGSTADGFPIDFGQPISRTPAAGDIDGDGYQELVVIGRAGKMATYKISRISTSVGCWLQMLFDESNSGSFGISYLPVVIAGMIDGEVSRGVQLPFTVMGRNLSSMTVAYSTNAGYTWNQTSSFRQEPGVVTWFSDEDIPGQDVDECVLKITPYRPDGPGVSGVSNIFHVDNNAPPKIYISSIYEDTPGRFLIHYAVEDPESDVIQIQGQYSIDGGQTWKNAHFSGSTIQIPSWLYGEPFIWNTNNEVGIDDPHQTLLRIRAADADPGEWVTTTIQEGMEGASIAQVIVPREESAGDVRLGLRLSDPNMDPSLLDWEFSTDGGRNWRNATITDIAVPIASSYHYDITWDSFTDMPGIDADTVRFRVLAPGQSDSVSVASSPFHVDNDRPPSIQILSPSRWDHFEGTVPISFDLYDAEDDTISLFLEYQIEGTTQWQQADGLIRREEYTPEFYNSTMVWNSAQDLPGLGGLELRIKVGAVDRDTVMTGEIGPIAIDNSDLPSVMQAAFRSVIQATGLATVSFELSDPDGRSLDLQVAYSTDGGQYWRDATVTGDLFSLSRNNYQGNLQWQFGEDLRDRESGHVLLKLTPVSDDLMGTPKILRMELGP